jgi:dephospho-CoA kinase
MVYAVGVTGGIGSGKSTVAELFAKAGAEVIDTDQIAHALTGPEGAAMPAIRAAFGDAFVDARGALDRSAMRHLVFSDAQAKSKLEALLHPRIDGHVRERLSKSIAPYALVVVPLLVETGTYRGLLDRVLVVDCDEALQRSRTMARSALSSDQVQAIMRAQATRDERLVLADDVISNDDTEQALGSQVRRLDLKYRALALSEKRG